MNAFDKAFAAAFCTSAGIGVLFLLALLYLP